MKKLLMTIVALVCLVATASAQSVYVSTGDGAVAYHKNKSCSYLANSKDVKSVTTAEAKKMGRHECARCYGTAASAASKKAAEKKVTTQARDEKGRFVKKADATTKKAETAAKKTTTQARDEKGRFVKKADTEKKATEKKAKTEKKAAEKSVKKEKKAAEKSAKKEKKAVEKSINDTKKKTTPARDEKGRFIKKAA